MGEEEDAKVLELLPRGIKRAIVAEVRREFLINHPVLFAIRIAHCRCFYRLCCDALFPKFVASDEIVFEYGRLCLMMYFVSAGSLTYLRCSGSINPLSGG